MKKLVFFAVMFTPVLTSCGDSNRTDRGLGPNRTPRECRYHNRCFGLNPLKPNRTPRLFDPFDPNLPKSIWTGPAEDGAVGNEKPQTEQIIGTA